MAMVASAKAWLSASVAASKVVATSAIRLMAGPSRRQLIITTPVHGQSIEFVRFIDGCSVRRPAAILLVLALLVLVGCHRGAGPSGDDGGEAAEAAGNLVAPTVTPSTAELETRAAAALRAILPGPPGAFADLRGGFNGAICGQVETASAPGFAGELRAFLVDGRGEAFLSSSPGLRLEDPSDSFPDLYIQWCATPEEIAAIRQRMRTMRPSDLQVGEPETFEDPQPDRASPPASHDEAESEARPRPAPQPGRDESFFNAVVRPPRD